MAENNTSQPHNNSVFNPFASMFAMPGMELFQQAATTHTARLQGWLEEYSRLEAKQVEQLRTMLDESAKLTRASLDYMTQLGTEWRRWTTDAARTAMSATTAAVAPKSNG